MRKFLRIGVAFIAHCAVMVAQTNTFPSSGPVGIGTISPTYSLHLSTGNILRIEGGAYGSTDTTNYFSFGGTGTFGIDAPGVANGRFVVLSSGNVGIWTTAPQNALSLAGGINVDQDDENNGTNNFPTYQSTLGISFGNSSGEGIGSARSGGFGSLNQYGLDFFTGFTKRLSITNTGNVGIGTTSPSAKLELNGNLLFTQPAAGGQPSGASITFSDATVQSTAWNGTTLGGDYAEAIDVLGNRAEYEPGDVIVIDSASPGKFGKSDKAYSKLVAGVFSTKPGLVGRRLTIDRPNKEAEVPMAMVGIVPTKVSAENGPIEPGDLLVSASKPGYAMKGTDGSRLIGTVLGKALAPLRSGLGVIEVMITVQ